MEVNGYEDYDAYGTYDIKGEDPYSILMKMSSWNKAIRSTISEVVETANGTLEKQSQIIQEVERINLNVLDITTTLDGTTRRVGSLEVRSDSIELNVTKIDTRLGSAEGSIIVLAGYIDLKADSVVVDDLGSRMHSAELSIDGLNSQILLKADSSIVTAQGTRLTQAEVDIDGLNSQIDLKASSASLSDLGVRVNTAEININGLSGSISSKVSSTDYNGNTIASLINQSATTINILASRINFIGAVAVLSDISGNLGTITAGTLNSVTINTAQDINVGNRIYLGRYGTGTKSIIIAEGVGISSSGWGMELTAVSGVSVENLILAGTSANFAGVTSINWGNNRPAATWG